MNKNQKNSQRIICFDEKNTKSSTQLLREERDNNITLLVNEFSLNKEIITNILRSNNWNVNESRKILSKTYESISKTSVLNPVVDSASISDLNELIHNFKNTLPEQQIRDYYSKNNNDLIKTISEILNNHIQKHNTIGNNNSNNSNNSTESRILQTESRILQDEKNNNAKNAENDTSITTYTIAYTTESVTQVTENVVVENNSEINTPDNTPDNTTEKVTDSSFIIKINEDKYDIGSIVTVDITKYSDNIPNKAWVNMIDNDKVYTYEWVNIIKNKLEKTDMYEYVFSSTKFKMNKHGNFKFELVGRYNNEDKVLATSDIITVKPEFYLIVDSSKGLKELSVKLIQLFGFDYSGSTWLGIYYLGEVDKVSTIDVNNTTGVIESNTTQVFDYHNYDSFIYINVGESKNINFTHNGKWKVCLFIDNSYKSYIETEFIYNFEDKFDYEIKDDKMIITHDINSVKYDGLWVGVFRLDEAGESRRRYSYLTKNKTVEFSAVKHDGKYLIKIIDTTGNIILSKEFSKKTEVIVQ